MLATDGGNALRAAPSRSVALENVDVPAPAATGARVYAVANGGNLSMTCFRCYDLPNRWQESFNAKTDVMRNQNQLAPGMKLRIP